MKSTQKMRNGDIDVKIGARLRLIRTNNGWSQEKLAEKIGITFQQVQKYEKGTNRVSLSTMIVICQTLHITVDAFLGDLVDADAAPIIPRMIEIETENRQLRVHLSRIRSITTSVNHDFGLDGATDPIGRNADLAPRLGWPTGAAEILTQ